MFTKIVQWLHLLLLLNILQAVDTTVLGLSKEEAVKKPYIASMGVYLFKKEILLNLLRYRSSEVALWAHTTISSKGTCYRTIWEYLGLPLVQNLGGPLQFSYKALHYTITNTTINLS